MTEREAVDDDDVNASLLKDDIHKMIKAYDEEAGEATAEDVNVSLLHVDIHMSVDADGSVI